MRWPKGAKAYWVCPLVEDSEVSTLTAAQTRFEHLRAAFGAGAVGLVHGQLPPTEKDAAMADFAAGRTQLLVATTVIEVGVNVPNATIIGDRARRKLWAGPVAPVARARGARGRCLDLPADLRAALG